MNNGGVAQAGPLRPLWKRVSLTGPAGSNPAPAAYSE